MTDSYLYDSWGNILLTGGPTLNAFRYVGRAGYYLDWDSWRLLLRARYFDPQAGRFVSRDPLGFIASGENLYNYSKNNAANRTDASGLIDWCEVACHAACWGVASAICAAIFAGCTTAITVTFPIGGVVITIPCSAVWVAACGVSGVAASLCSDLFCPYACHLMSPAMPVHLGEGRFSFSICELPRVKSLQPSSKRMDAVRPSLADRCLRKWLLASRLTTAGN